MKHFVLIIELLIYNLAFFSSYSINWRIKWKAHASKVPYPSYSKAKWKWVISFILHGFFLVHNISNAGLFNLQSFIKCKNVNYESKRSETFYDIQLNVKGKKNSKFFNPHLVIFFDNLFKNPNMFFHVNSRWVVSWLHYDRNPRRW